MLFGTVIEAISCPFGVSSLRTIGEVTPKLPSTVELLKSSGKLPFSTAVLQGS